MLRLVGVLLRPALPNAHNRCEPADVEGIQAVAEQHQGRGCHHDRRGGGEGDGGDTGVGERS